MPSLVRALLQQNPADFCTILAHRHDGIAKLPIPGRRKFWVVSDPASLHEILVTKADTFDKGGPLYRTIARALGSEGLFTVNDRALWGRLHSLMYPSLRRYKLDPVTTLAATLWQERMETWETVQPIALFEEAKKFNMQLLAVYLFGLEVDSTQLVELASQVFAGMAGRIFLPTWLPGGAKYVRAINAFMAEIDRIIAIKRKMLSSETLLDSLFEATPSLTEKQLRDQVVTLLMAGHDSTATVFSWALIRLSERPSQYNRLRQIALATKDSSWNDQTELQEIERWIRAAAHDHPAFPLFFRNVTKTIVLKDKEIRAGDQIIVTPYATHHDTRYWQGFDDFLIQSKEQPTIDRRLAHLPFGKGARKCIGEDFAMRIAVVMLSELLRRFSSIARSSPHSGEKIRYAMTAPPRDGALMWLK
jgi:cytochrome P450